MKHIFEPVELKNLTIRNRLVRSATWEGIADPDGNLKEEAFGIYSKLAKGGVGAIITGFTSVVPHDHSSDGTMRLCDDTLIPQYRKLVDVIHAEGCPVITELALGDYYREKNGLYTQVEIDDMRSDEIRLVIRKFVDAAVRSQKAGFDGVQLHAAHFFFLSRFISPAANHRGTSMVGLLRIAAGFYWKSWTVSVQLLRRSTSRSRLTQATLFSEVWIKRSALPSVSCWIRPGSTPLRSAATALLSAASRRTSMRVISLLSQQQSQRR